jgi:hypothetical protein
MTALWALAHAPFVWVCVMIMVGAIITVWVKDEKEQS